MHPSQVLSKREQLPSCFFFLGWRHFQKAGSDQSSRLSLSKRYTTPVSFSSEPDTSCHPKITVLRIWFAFVVVLLGSRTNSCDWGLAKTARITTWRHSNRDNTDISMSVVMPKWLLKRQEKQTFKTSTVIPFRGQTSLFRALGIKHFLALAE